MNSFGLIFQNKILGLSLASMLIAQILKVITNFITYKKFDITRFVETGGMPSSHSAGVMGIASSVGLVTGFDSVSFAIALGFALVTMYDAAGVRRAAGKTAACLNRMMEDFYKHDVQAIGGKLKELLGHTPLEVIVGAIYGVASAIWLHTVISG